MAEMTTRERFQRMFNHTEADRVPWMESLWGTTLQRWHREGLPEGVDYRDHFGLDHVQCILPDYSPRYAEEELSRDDRYHTFRTKWGAVMRGIVGSSTPPDAVDFSIKSPDDWPAYKARMTPADDRIPWKLLEDNYATWRQRGDWISAQFWFGFDVTHARVTGTERMLMWMIEEPELVSDMFAHFLDMNIALFDRIIEAGYEMDEIFWPDDLGYKHSQFMSLQMYRDLLKPHQARAVQWAHERGIKAHLHSCGDVNPFIDDWIEIGIDALNPLEVKAGMDPVAIKQRYGQKLLLHGGINAVLWDHPDQIAEAMAQALPALKQNGGYVFASDHSVPDSVSLADFERIVALYHELGSYDA